MAKKWTDKELEILRREYPIKGTDIPELRKNRSVETIIARAKIENLTDPKANDWSDKELEILRRDYPTKGTKIPELRKTRTIRSILTKAHKEKLIIISRSKSKKWSDEELEILRREYPTKGTKIPELRKNRSAESIKNKAYNEKLYRDNYKCTNYKFCKKWSEEEVEILRREYPTKGTKIPELRKTRTELAIRSKAFLLNLTEPKADDWSDEELEILRREYLTEGYKIPELRKTRTDAAIIARAKIENLTDPRADDWSDEELEILRRDYPTKGINIPELRKTRTELAIRYRAKIENLIKIK